MIKEVEAAASAVGYQSLGTFEFLVDEDHKFYFMEANARVQVEHPITEMVYGINLIKAQIRIAAGEKFSFPYALEMRGHAIEGRINAEDPATFAPPPGRIDSPPRPGRPRRAIRHAVHGRTHGLENGRANGLRPFPFQAGRRTTRTEYSPPLSLSTFSFTPTESRPLEGAVTAISGP